MGRRRLPAPRLLGADTRLRPRERHYLRAAPARPARPPTVAGQLRAAGYTVIGTDNAPARAGRTTVTYPPGLERPAKALGARLRAPVTTEQDPAATPGAVSLTIGSDYPGLRGRPARGRHTPDRVVVRAGR